MTMPMIADFPQGARFDVAVQGGALPLVVHEVQGLPGGMREGGGFRVEFVGPAQPLLVQATYRFTRNRQAYELFIVPLGPNPHGMRYEALFL